jgi:glycosyltransferase involved in cell wall biosynthesis
MIRKHNTSSHSIDIKSYRELNGREWFDYDLIVSFFASTTARMVPKNRKAKVITGVWTHKEWDGQVHHNHPGKRGPGWSDGIVRWKNPPDSYLNMLRSFDGPPHVPSKKLEAVFSKYMKVCRLRIGVDFDCYYPRKDDNPTLTSNPLRVGWAGSLNNHGLKRGINDFFLPACKRAGCQPVMQLREHNRIFNDHDMREKFYRNIDVYLCTSITEGHPTGPLEAAACGIPTVSTDCGVMPELITSGKNGFIVNRDVDSIAEQLHWLSNNRHELIVMGKRSRRVMEEDWNWKYNVCHWIDYFEKVLGNRQ